MLERIVRRRRAQSEDPPGQAWPALPDAPAPETHAVNGTLVHGLDGAALDHLNGASANGAERSAEPQAVIGPAPTPFTPPPAPPPEPAPPPAGADPQPEALPEHSAEPEAPTAEIGALRPASEPESSPEASGPGFKARGRLRRRARYLRRLRELELRDIGGFMVELNRFGRVREDLVEGKVAAAARTDEELRALDRVLSERSPLRELRAAGIGGACEQCGAVHGSVDRFCASCGTQIGAGAIVAESPADPPDAASAAPAPDSTL